MIQVLLAVLDQLAGNASPAVKSYFPLLFAALLLVTVLLRYFTAGATANKQARHKLPPSPPALPLIGHLHLVGAHPHVSMRSLAARHGSNDLMLLRLGTVPTFVVSSPRVAQLVLRAHDPSFASRPRSIFGDILSYGPSDVAFSPYGERWRQNKKLVTTHVLSAKKVQFYHAAREEEVGMVIGKIRNAATAHATVDMSELLSSFTNDMVSRAVAGRSFRADGLDRVFKEVMDASMAVLSGFNLENFFPGLAKVAGGVLMRPGRRRAERLRDWWDKVLDRVIDEHASRAAVTGAAECHESDFTDVLLSLKEEYGLTRDNIKGILANMFTAGTDTAYLVLEYTMAQLMRHQDVMAKLQTEVRSSTGKEHEEATTKFNLTGMPYLKAVIKETLRLHPPSPLLLPHLSLEDCTIDGYMVPAGMTVFINVWAIGRDPSLWDAAEEFMPERFINKDGADGAVDFRGLDFQFLPFGSGRRMCPGMNFALASIEMMLANLVYHFDWEMPKGVSDIDMTEVFGLTVHRKVKLILAPRLACVAGPLEG